MSQDEDAIKGFAIMDMSTRGGQYVASWRVNAPYVDKEKCTGCSICLAYCPEGAVLIGENQKSIIDLRFCKGCGICANECPQRAISMKGEKAKN
jgi:2-oxoacid:acceptor oxidoreductase delta subunit (pyruvate/2-ketoisovalerate family)